MHPSTQEILLDACVMTMAAMHMAKDLHCLRAPEIGMCAAGVLIESDNEKKRRSKIGKIVSGTYPQRSDSIYSFTAAIVESRHAHLSLMYP
jgi:hypothetical protein